MDIYEENEKIDLKATERYSERSERKKFKNKKNSKNKTSDGYNCLTILIILLIITIGILVFIKILMNERQYYENIIKKLDEEQQLLLKNNTLLKYEKIYYQNLSKNYLNELGQLGTKMFDPYASNFTNYKIVAISYGNERFSDQLKYNGQSAFEFAKVDKFYGYTPNDIDPEFKEKNSYILEKSRGNGYWLWKPYFIYKTLKEKLNYGDFLIYSDAAIIYVDLAQKLVDFLNEKKLDMYTHRLPHLERHYTKRDAFILLGVDAPFYAETGQFNAAFQVYRKTKFTEFFLGEYLYYAQDKRIITDDANELGVDNYEGFRDHRHDQSILSLLIKKYGQVNANRTNLDLELVKKYEEVMPTVFCHYRGRRGSDYESVKEMCKGVRGNIS